MKANFENGLPAKESKALNTFKLNSLKDLFINELGDVYAGELSVMNNLTKLKGDVTSSELQEAFDDYLSISNMHLKIIDDLYATINIKVDPGECQAVEGVFQQIRKFINIEDPSVRDAALITSIQKIVHVMISSWGTLKAFAKEMDYTDALDCFQDALEEEIEMDDVLSDIARDYINQNTAD